MSKFDKKIDAQQIRAIALASELSLIIGEELTFMELLDALAIHGLTLEPAKRHNWASLAYLDQLLKRRK